MGSIFRFSLFFSNLEKTEGVDYERFIDGLRAISVCAVIYYHLFPKFLSGGFVGVDVFFVISGYLITSQIRRESLAGKFSIGSFYARRIRRIVPALVVVLFASSVFAMIVLKPEDMHSFAKSLIAQPLSLQNFVFLAEGEYFRGSETKPLLHTWSLAIEEQFYLVWPWILLGLRFAAYRTLVALILFLIIISFVLNNVAILFSPKASFFLLPTRSWELAVGGLGAVLNENCKNLWAKSERLAASIALLGMVFIVLSIICIDSSMPFPGYVGFLPVIGVFFVLLSGARSRVLQQVLTNRVMVTLGLLSYSLYLWHWPVLTFMHHMDLSTQTIFGVLAFVFVTFSLSIATYHLIEVPVRQRRFLASNRMLFVSAVAIAILLFIFALHVIYTKGALYRFSVQSRPFLAVSFDSQDSRCGFFFRALKPGAEICELVKSQGGSDRQIFLWGNSHADMWSKALSEKMRLIGGSLWLNAKNCRGTPDGQFCNKELQDQIIHELYTRKPTDVILASSWYGSYGIADNQFERELRLQVERLIELGARVWLVGDIPTAPQFDPLVAYGLNPERPVGGIMSASVYAKQREREMNLFNDIRTLHPQLVHVIDVSSAFCNEVTCISGKDDEVWYRDDNHLTNTGARASIHVFDPLFFLNATFM